jgi:hypothetical protein
MATQVVVEHVAKYLWLANCYFAHNSLRFPVLWEYLDHILFWTTAKTSCPISEPTLTTIERMIQWKDERRIHRYLRVSTNRESPLDSLATALSRPVPDAGGRLIDLSLALAMVFGRPRQNFQEIVRCFSYCKALPRSDRFPATDAFRKWNSSHSRNAMSGKNGLS